MISHPTLKRGTSETTKQQVFRFFHQLLYQYSISQYFFAFLLALEGLQIVYLALHPACCGLWQVPGFGVFRTALGYLAGALAWQSCSVTLLIVFNAVFLIIGLIAFGVILYEVKNATTDYLTATNNFREIRIKLIQYLSTLFRTVLIIPLSSLQTYSIVASYQSSNGLNIICIALAIASFLCCSTLTYFFLELAIDNSPFSNFSLAGPITSKQKIKSILNFILGIVSACLPSTCSSTSDSIHLIFLILVYLGFVYVLYLYYSEANLVCNLIRKVQEHVIATVAPIYLVTIFQKLVTPGQNITLFFAFLICVMANFGWIRIKRLRENSLIFSVYKNLTSKCDILAYNYLMCQYIRDFYKDPFCLVKLEGILSDHVLHCKKLDEVCKCRILKSKIRLFSYDNDPVEASLEAPHWFEFMKANLLFNTQKMSHLPQFHLLLSYIEKNILKNNFLSYVNLQRCSLKKTSISIDFLIYHQKRVIQRTLTIEDRRNNEKKQVDVNRFIEMTETVEKFHEKVLKSSLEHLQFWKALTGRKKNKQNIMKQGNNLLQTVKQCEQLYKSITQTYPYNLQSIVLFSNYSKYILNNHELILKNRSLFTMIKKKLCRSIKISSQQEKEKYSENSVTGAIVISGQRSNVGIIKACTAKVTSILKFAPYELIGQNVNTIMPIFLGHMHNQVLIKYLDQAEPQSNFVQRCAPMLDKNNFMILSRIMTKSLPSLINGLQIIGLFQKIKQTNIRHMNESPRYLLYRCDNGNIEALSENFHSYYGYRLMKVNQYSEISQELNFSTIFPDIGNGDIKGDGGGGEGLECEIRLKKGNKRVVRVRVYCRMELMYFGIRVRLLSVFSCGEGNFNSMMLQNAMTINQGATQMALSEKSSSANDQTHKQLQTALLEQKNNPSTLQDQQLKTLQTRMPHKFRLFQALLLTFTILLLSLSIVQFYFNMQAVTVVNSYLEHSEYLSNSLLYLVNIGYYGRMMQLAAMFPSKMIGEFQGFRGNVTVFTDALQKAEFWLVNKETQYSAFINFSYPDLPVSWQIGQQSRISSKSTTLSLNIFDLVTSSSSLSSSTPQKFNFPQVLTATTSSTTNSSQFRNLFRIRYSSLFELIPAKQKYAKTLFQAYCNKIQQYFKINNIELGLACGIVAIFLIIYLKILSKILYSIFSITTLFNLLNPHEIDKEIIRCETFLEHFFINCYEVVLRLNKNKILRGPSFEELEGLANQKTNHNCLMKTGNYNVDEETQKRSEVDLDQKNYMEGNDEIDLVKISEKNFKGLESKIKDEENAEDGVLLGKEGGEQETANEDKDEGLDVRNFLIFLPKVAGILFLLLYFIGTFLYRKINHGRLYIEIQNQNLLYHNIEGLQTLKYYSLESSIDPSPFQTYQSLPQKFQQLAADLYHYQQLLNGFGEVDVYEYPLQELISRYNLDGVCRGHGEFKASVGYASGSYSVAECRAIDGGVLDQGYRAAIVAYIENVKNMTNQGSIQQLMSSKSFLKARLLDKYVKYPIQRMVIEDTQNSINYLQKQTKITVAFFSLFIFCTIAVTVFVSLSTGKNLMIRILGTYQIISLIPQRIFHRNANLCAEYRKNVKELME